MAVSRSAPSPFQWMVKVADWLGETFSFSSSTASKLMDSNDISLSSLEISVSESLSTSASTGSALRLSSKLLDSSSLSSSVSREDALSWDSSLSDSLLWSLATESVDNASGWKLEFSLVSSSSGESLLRLAGSADKPSFSWSLSKDSGWKSARFSVSLSTLRSSSVTSIIGSSWISSQAAGSSWSIILSVVSRDSPELDESSKVSDGPLSMLRSSAKTLSGEIHPENIRTDAINNRIRINLFLIILLLFFL